MTNPMVGTKRALCPNTDISPACGSLRRAGGAALVAVCSLVALGPFLGALPATHDGLHHVFRLFELDRALRAWHLYPRVFADMGFGYGYPVLNYYSPLSYYLAWVGTSLGAGYLGGLKLAYSLSVIASALAMYAWVGAFFPRPAAFLAAMLYTFAPYHMADIYVRGALAESVAFVWPPLLLALVWRQRYLPSTKTLVLLALAVAGFVLTHNLTAFMFAPVLALYWVLLRPEPSRGIRLLRHGWPVAAVVAGLALSAFYWIPATLEVRYVLAGHVDGLPDLLPLLQPLSQWVSRVLVHRYTPFQGVGGQHPLSIAQAVITVAGTAVAAASWRRLAPDARAALAIGLTILITSAFLLTPASALLWRHLPGLRYLQFPWRLQAVITLATAVIGGYAATAFAGAPGSRVFAGMAALAIAATSMAGLRLEPAHLPTAAPPLTEEQIGLDGVLDYDFQTALWLREYGGDWLLEYLPIWALLERDRFFLPTGERVALAPLPAGATVRVLEDAPLRTVLHVRLPEPTTIRLRRFYFPGWQARLAGAVVAGRPEGNAAVLSFDLPAGEYDATFSLGATPARMAGTGVTCAATLVLAAVAIRRRLPSTLAMAAMPCLLFLALVALRANLYPTTLRPQYIDADVGEAASLVGYAKSPSPAGVDVWLYWLGRRQPDADYRAFVHAVDGSWNAVAQHDGQPGSEFTPTTRWLPGEMVLDRHRLASTSQPCRLLAGLYTWPEVANLPVTQDGTAVPDGRIVLGECGG